jgi:hypothetical protein
MDLQRQHLRPAPREDLDLRNNARADAVADEVGQSLLQVERVGHTTDMAASVLHADQQRATRRVGEGHDRFRAVSGEDRSRLNSSVLPSGRSRSSIRSMLLGNALGSRLQRRF